MKKIEIITRPFHLDVIKDNLSAVGVNNIIASDVRVSGDSSGQDSYLQEDYFVEFMPKVKIEFYISQDDISNVVDRVKSLALEEGEEDMDIYVYDVEKKL